ncbi:MAG: dephospho-CoA kinase, partial [Muribaculaceae bacterium]|nr:dephospho-CoA kinase [Muribaculaceae bacterium]
MEDATIIQEISSHISKTVINPDCNLSRQRLGEIVFTDHEKLQLLNNIVHHHVRADIAAWIERHHDSKSLWIETAILYQSGLDKMVNEIWEVTAPTELRINRVMHRNSMTCDQVQNRIDSQRNSAPKDTRNHIIIANDGVTPLLPRIEALLASIDL